MTVLRGMKTLAQMILLHLLKVNETAKPSKIWQLETDTSQEAKEGK